MLSFRRLLWFSHLARSAVRPTFSSWRRRSDRRESKNRELKDFQKSKVSPLKKKTASFRISEFPWLLMIRRDIWHCRGKTWNGKVGFTVYVLRHFCHPLWNLQVQRRSFWVSRSCRRFQKPVTKINTTSWLNVPNIATLLRCFHPKKWHLQWESLLRFPKEKTRKASTEIREGECWQPRAENTKRDMESVESPLVHLLNHAKPC